MAEKKKVDYKPRTAQIVAADTWAGQDSEGKELAEEAGVVNPAHVDYVEALENYESRDDVESLANRRARESGVSFSDADFVRTNDPSGTVTAADATHKDVEEADKALREQAKATADAAADKNEPASTITPDDDDKKKSSKK